MDTTIISSVTDTLPSDCQRKLEGYAKAIDKAKAKGVDAILEIGRALCAARDTLANHGDGIYGAWIEQRCGISRMTAHNYTSIREVFGDRADCKPVLQSADIKALCFLARDTTPEDAIERAVEAAEAGERITLKKAKAIVAECTAQPEATDEAEGGEVVIPPQLRPYESLTDAIDALHAAIAAVYLRWPTEYTHVLADKLMAMGEELQEKGTLVC